MKSLKLLELNIQNFKGVKALSLNFDGEDAAIYGANATAKTTLYDAWLWLFFNKDSSGRADFSVKPQKDGVEIHNLETIVEALVSINGKIVRVSKKLYENWVKKRGSSAPTLEGNKKEYLIDGLPCKESEWKRFVFELAGDEEAFEALSISTFFLKDLKWEARRNILLRMIDDIPVDEIAKNSEKYAAIWALIEGETIENATAKVKYQIKELQRQQRELPARIDELHRGLSELDEDGCKKAQKEIERLENLLACIDSQLSDIAQISERIAGLHQRISKSEREKQDKIAAARDEALKDWRDGKWRYLEAENNANLAATNITRKRQQVETMEAELVRMNKDISELRTKAIAMREEAYNPSEDDCVCPVCHQDMPEDMRETAKQRWEADKAKRVDEITATGVAFREKIKNYEFDLKTQKEVLEHLEREEKAILLKLANLEIYNGDEPEVSAEVDTSSQDSDIADAKAELERLSQGDNSSLLDDKRKIASELNAVRASIASFEASKKTLVRIAELEEEERSVGERVAALQGQIFLLEELTTEKCNLAEEKINALFPTLRWKLFDTQINGGIKDTCVCLIDGVPYPDANNAAKVNAGLEAIQVLSSHYGLSAPVFVDNAESVNELMPVDAQLIALTVSRDKPLRLETINKSEVA